MNKASWARPLFSSKVEHWPHVFSRPLSSLQTSRTVRLKPSLELLAVTFERFVYLVVYERVRRGPVVLNLAGVDLLWDGVHWLGLVNAPGAGCGRVQPDLQTQASQEQLTLLH